MKYTENHKLPIFEDADIAELNKYTEELATKLDDATSKQDKRIEEQLKNMTLDSPSDAEIVDARGNYSLLGNRLNANDSIVKQKIYYFENVEKMKSCTNLKEGDVCKTLGEYEINDGGSETYQIVNSNASDNFISLNNNLFAKKIKYKDYDVKSKIESNNLLENMQFRRKFAVNLYKNLKLKLCDMNFYKNWINETEGNPYPIYYDTADYKSSEIINKNMYTISNTSGDKSQARRFVGRLFPYASYSLTVNEQTYSTYGCRIGFNFVFNSDGTSNYTETKQVDILLVKTSTGKINLMYEIFLGRTSQGIVTLNPEQLEYKENMKLVVTIRGNKFDVYIDYNDNPEFVGTISNDEINYNKHYGTWQVARVFLKWRLGNNESVTISSCQSYMDCGICQADIRPIKYENGMPLISDGKLFLLMSSRFQADSYQAIISYTIGTCEFNLEGALFFDYGDGYWQNDIASSVIYNRTTKEWLIWTVAFNKGHILAYGKAKSDIRHGINVIDMTLMDIEDKDENNQASLSDDTIFKAKYGDEDPDFMFDEEERKWKMIICRLSYNNEGADYGYRYFLFESDNPFTDYKFIGKTADGSHTGGNFVKVGGILYLVCGSCSDLTSRYYSYRLPNLDEKTQVFQDLQDGGFRGWGTIIPVPVGNRTQYLWFTFDRANGSDYTWSYGNVYLYESDLFNVGYEGDIKYSF